MQIHGIDRFPPGRLEEELARGGRFVYYEYCISLIFITLRRPTDIYFLPAHNLGIMRGLLYATVSFFLGWWGLPWGVIYTPLTIFTDLSGGRDVTEQVLAMFQETAHESR